MKVVTSFSFHQEFFGFTTVKITASEKEVVLFQGIMLEWKKLEIDLLDFIGKHGKGLKALVDEYRSKKGITSNDFFLSAKELVEALHEDFQNQDKYMSRIDIYDWLTANGMVIGDIVIPSCSRHGNVVRALALDILPPKDFGGKATVAPAPEVEENMEEDLKAFHEALKAHDWYYDFTDDKHVWRNGKANEEKLMEWSQKSPEHRKMWTEFDAVARRTSAGN